MWRCCEVDTVTGLKLRELDNSLITGAILIASGRVPTTTAIGSFFIQQPGVLDGGQIPPVRLSRWIATFVPPALKKLKIVETHHDQGMADLASKDQFRNFRKRHQPRNQIFSGIHF